MTVDTYKTISSFPFTTIIDFGKRPFLPLIRLGLHRQGCLATVLHSWTRDFCSPVCDRRLVGILDVGEARSLFWLSFTLLSAGMGAWLGGRARVESWWGWGLLRSLLLSSSSTGVGIVVRDDVQASLSDWLDRPSVLIAYRSSMPHVFIHVLPPYL
jgi:hypothetical protein